MLQRLPEPKLTALLAVVDHIFRFALRERHIQCRQHSLCGERLAHRPTHHAPTQHLQHDSQVDQPRPCGNESGIGHPPLVGLIGSQYALDQIGRGAGPWRALRGDDKAAATAPAAQSDHANAFDQRRIRRFSGRQASSARRATFKTRHSACTGKSAWFLITSSKTW